MKEPKIRFKEFKGEWKEKYLNSLASYICSGKNTNMQGPYPLYGSTGIIGSTDKPYHTGPMLLVARVGANAGYLQLIDKECGVSDNTLIIQPNNELPETYLFYYFVHLNLNRFIYGSGQPLITGGMLKKMPVRFGSTIETKKLASFFTTIDAQISASTSRLASLKQIKAASLQAMFPQEGETVPKLRFKGFEGEWNEITIGKITTVKRGVRITRKDLSNLGTYPVYQNTDYPMGYYNHFNVAANNPFVIIGGSAGLIGFSESDFWAADDCAYFEDNENIDKKFLYALLLHRSRYINKNVRSSSVPRLDRQVLTDLNVYLPHLQEQRAIASYFTNLDRQITLQNQRLEKLKQIKVACLDKMFV